MNNLDIDVVVQQQNSTKTVPLPFLSKADQARKYEIDDELLQTFSKIPKFAKLLKELCTNKRKKLKGGVEVGRNAFALIKSKQFSALIQPVMPKKCSDPGTFFVPCTIGKCNFDAMLDLLIQLANKNTVYPLGILEDMLLQVTTTTKRFINIQFLKKARTKIDVHAGTLSMKFGDNRVEYNIFEAMKHPTKNHLVLYLDVINQMGAGVIDIADVNIAGVVEVVAVQLPL
ncbi:hypothetical protein CR513_36213, partial [Mucuna pruriens]